MPATMLGARDRVNKKAHEHAFRMVRQIIPINIISKYYGV
jgi:hypothetical protein